MNLLMLVLMHTVVPLMTMDTRFPDALMYFSLAMFGPVTVYALSQRALYPDWISRFRYFAVLMLLGTGIALNNSLAVLEAFTRRGNTFRRTPKFRVESDDDAWDTKRYTLPFSWEAVGELALAAYAFVGVAIAWQHQLVWTLPYLILYAASFMFVGALGLWHSRPVRSREIEFAPASN